MTNEEQTDFKTSLRASIVISWLMIILSGFLFIYGIFNIGILIVSILSLVTTYILISSEPFFISGWFLLNPKYCWTVKDFVWITTKDIDKFKEFNPIKYKNDLIIVKCIDKELEAMLYLKLDSDENLGRLSA